MNKKQIALIVVIMIVVVIAVDLLIGNYISARLATTSWARQWGLFNPQAPIVVTNRETVRVNTNNDLVDTAENAKNKTAALVYLDGNELVTTGSAVTWTSDGYFVAAFRDVVEPGKTYAVVTAGGDLFPVEAIYSDTASALIVLQTSARDLTVFSPVDKRDLRVGQQVVMIQNSIGVNQARFYTGFIKRLSDDVSGIVMNSDRVSRNIELILPEAVPGGSAVLNLSGRMIGIWDGQSVVPVEEVREMVNNLLANDKQYVRPSFGFSYEQLNEVQAKALQMETGARVIGVAPNSAASRAGLRGGDVITVVDDRDLDDSFNLDNWLRQAKPGQVVNLSVQRGTMILTIPLTVEQL